MSKCHRIHHLIGPYLYDDVSPKERAAVEAHLEQCAACRAEVEALRELISAIPSDTVPADAAAKARTLRAVQSRIAEEQARRPRWRRWRETVFATALAATAALLFNLWTTYRPPQIMPPAPAADNGAASRRNPTEIAAGTLWAPSRSARASSSSSARHGGRQANRRRNGTATPVEAADGGRHDEAVAVAPPASPQEEQAITPALEPRQTHDNHGSVTRQVAPATVVAVALVVPAPVAAPTVRGVDDVTQAAVAPEQE